MAHFNKFFSSFFSSASNGEVGTCVVTTWQLSFHLISVTAQHCKDLWIPSNNLPLLQQIDLGGCKPHWSTKKEKKASCKKWLLEGVAKKLSKKFHKIHREIPLLESLSITVKCFQAVTLATRLKRDPRTSFSEPAICRSSTRSSANRCSWIIGVHRKHLCCRYSSK